MTKVVAYMILTEVVRETTLSSLALQVPKYTHPTRVGYQDLWYGFHVTFCVEPTHWNYIACAPCPDPRDALPLPQHHQVCPVDSCIMCGSNNLSVNGECGEMI